MVRLLSRATIMLAGLLMLHAIPVRAASEDEDPRSQTYKQNQDKMLDNKYSGQTKEEDTSYKDEEIKGTDKVYGVQSSTAIPHLTTKRFLPGELSEWYWISMQNPPKGTDETSGSGKEGLDQWTKDVRNNADSNVSPNGAYKTSPYIGPLYRTNEFNYNTRVSQPSNAGWSGDKPEGQDDAPPSDSKSASGSSTRSCKGMIQPGSGMSASDPVYNPEWMRLELDNCANQFILRQNARYSNMTTEKQSPIHGYSEDSCQKMKVVPVAESDREYAADWYLAIAWEKLLTNGDYLARDGKAPMEPNYGDGSGPNAHHIKISDPIAVPSKFGHTETSDLAVPEKDKSDGGGGGATETVERMLTPINLSPREDFEYNDREKYSPMTTPYGGNPKDAVRCGGGNIKVDVMSFRAERFRGYIMARINWNIACYLNSYCKTYIWDPKGCTSDAPCCSTRFDQADKVPTAWCNAASGQGNAQVTAEQLCSWLAKPVVPINMLKMREANETNFPSGVPEGMTFKDYYKDHRPYMRCPDTGKECGVEGDGDYKSIASSDKGSKWAVLGAGREGQNCSIDGGGGRLGTPKNSQITSWTGLKLYQMAAIRSGLYCLPRNDVFFKPKGGEDYVLSGSGATVQTKVPDSNGEMTQLQNVVWPKSFRGYVMENDPAKRFPNLGGSGTMTTGLSTARPGNIAIFDQDVVMTGSARGEGETGSGKGWRIPYVATVEAGDNQSARGSSSGGSSGGESVTLIAHDHGKFPDVCGHSQTDQGMGQAFTVWKDKLPENIDEQFSKVGKSTKNCDDPALTNCIEPLWDKVKIYDIYKDVRK